MYLLIVYGIFFILCFEGFFIDLGAPTSLKYILDILNLLLFAIAVKKAYKISRTFKLVILWYLFFGGIGTLSAIANISKWDLNIIFWLLDCRLFLRFPIFLISCGILLNKDDVESIFNKLLVFQLINSLLIIYQYLTFEAADYWMRGDYLNGFFGTARGGNMYVNVLLVAVTLIAYDRLEQKKIKLWHALLLWASCLIDATLIELKVYYIEIIICFFMIFFLDNPIMKIKEKKIKIFIAGFGIGLIVLPVMIEVLYKLYPTMEGTLTISKIIEIASSSEGYTSSGDLNRLTAVGQVYSEIFNQDIVDGLIGIGLGNANTGGQMSLFAQLYEKTHYSYFQSSYVFIETGIIGLLLYASSFFIFFIQGKKSRYSVIVQIMSIMSIILVIYDEVLRTEGGYIVYFILSLAFISTKVESRKELINGRNSIVNNYSSI